MHRWIRPSLGVLATLAVIGPVLSAPEPLTHSSAVAGVSVLTPALAVSARPSVAATIGGARRIAR